MPQIYITDIFVTFIIRQHLASTNEKHNFIKQHAVNFVFELSFLKLSCYLAIKCKLSDLSLQCARRFLFKRDELFLESHQVG